MAEQNQEVIALPMLADRARLHATLKPDMGKASFDNWLHRSMKLHGFPLPIRTGARSASWLVSEVQAWLASRPRGGTFAGRRRGQQPAA
jgi:predicted DNA-binding transcriptional regulator AlpA